MAGRTRTATSWMAHDMLRHDDLDSDLHDFVEAEWSFTSCMAQPTEACTPSHTTGKHDPQAHRLDIVSFTAHGCSVSEDIVSIVCMIDILIVCDLI